MEELNNQYESQTLDTDEDMLNTDIRINPSYYIHRGITKAQDALMMPDLKEGLFRYRIIVENLKIFAKSANIIEIEEFNQKVEKYKEGMEEEKELHIRLFKIANFEMGLILEEVFSNEAMMTPARL